MDPEVSLTCPQERATGHRQQIIRSSLRPCVTFHNTFRCSECIRHEALKALMHFLEEPSGSIFRLEVNMEASGSSRTLLNAFQHYTAYKPRRSILELYGHESLKYYFVTRLFFLSLLWGRGSNPLSNLQARGPSLFGCPRLVI
jgi:hypothetical protein